MKLLEVAEGQETPVFQSPRVTSRSSIVFLWQIYTVQVLLVGDSGNFQGPWPEPGGLLPQNASLEAGFSSFSTTPAAREASVT